MDRYPIALRSVLDVDLRLPEWLKARLQEPLPGPMVGSRYEPQGRPSRHYDAIPSDARQAAVLLLLYCDAAGWHIPLTLRPAHLPDHAGQISLPGGAIERGETAWQAALREFHEELGGHDTPIEPLGRLSAIYVEVSHYRVEPWVALAAQRPAMTPNPDEVAALLEVPLEHLADPANLGCHPRQHQGVVYQAPHFAWQSHRVWGATCMILGEFVTLLEAWSETGR